jgi:hypothetical protein
MICYTDSVDEVGLLNCITIPVPCGYGLLYGFRSVDEVGLIISQSDVDVICYTDSVDEVGLINTRVSMDEVLDSSN